MTEILFILVTVYTVYVVHSVVCKGRTKKTEPIAEKPKKPETEKPNKNEKPKAVVKPVATKQKPAPKKSAPEKKKPAVPAGSLRNPETGEIDKVASSYRMLKRWMKEALVKEKLLDKIYKTNELDDAAKQKAKTALDKLKKMKKYQ